MVTQFGMSDKLGNVDLYSNYNRLSSETKQQIEDEVRKLLEEGRERAMKLLVEKRTELDRLAKALVSYETLDREEAFKVIRGEPLEGKLELSDGNIKMPGGGPSRIEMSPIPGSADADGQKAPPKGPVLV
jgi:ATP-dependent metalloprotease